MLSGRCPAERGRGRGEGNPISPPQKFDPRVAVIGDLDLEAVELALQSSVRRQPGEEGVDEALAAGEGRLLPHPTDGLRRDPEPHLAAVGVELGPVPEGPPVGFPAGGARRQATWTGCWAGYRRTAGQPRSDGPGAAVRGRGPSSPIGCGLRCRSPTNWPSRAAASMAWSRGSSSWPGCGGAR